MAFVIYAATGTASLAVPPAVAVGLAPRLYFQRRHAKVLAERRAAWPEAIRDVLANLAAGHTLHRSLCLLGHSGPLPLRPTWQRYERNAAALDVATALDLARAELADPVSDRVIEAFAAAHEHGRDVIVAVLRSLADNVTKRPAARRADRHQPDRDPLAGRGRRDPAVRRAGLPRRRQRRLPLLLPDDRRLDRRHRSASLMAVGGWKLITVLGRIPVEERVLDRTRRHAGDGRPRRRPSPSLAAVAAGCLARAFVRQPRPLATRVQPVHGRPSAPGSARSDR